jgi:FdhD protein
MSEAQRSVRVVRIRGNARAADTDRAAAEEPLEIRLHNHAFAVLMRTPGADRELAAGFLLSERIVRDAANLGTIAHCRDEDQRRENIVNVTLTDGSGEAVSQLLAERRQVLTNSSCGLCGRTTIESLAIDVPPVGASWTIRSAVVSTLPAALRARQVVFDDTGGLHAAGLFARDGTLVDMAEDVGRHNAVDKLIGRALMREALPLSESVLCVSGRTSYEIIQKAVIAGVPIVAAVSAPSSLAIELADAFHVTLAGFVRGEDFNIYTHPERIDN